MYKAIASPRVLVATGILFTIATIFNDYAGVTPSPALGGGVQRMMPSRTGITPGELPMCPPEGSCPVS